MLSHPLTLSQSEYGGRDKPGMAPPSDVSATRDPASPPLPLAEELNATLPLAADLNATLPMAEDLNAVLPLAEDSNTVLPLAEAWTQTESSTPQTPPRSSPPSSPPPSSSLQMPSQKSPQMPPSSPPLTPSQKSHPSSSPQMPPHSSPPSSSPQMLPQMPPPSSSPPPVPPPASPPPGPCVLCSSVLPRLVSSLLSLHQKEMRRLVEGAVASFERRLSALERRLDAEGEEPAPGPSQSQKRRRRTRDEKETRRKRRKHRELNQSEESTAAEGQSEKSMCAVAGSNGIRPPISSRFSSHDPLGAAMGWRFSDSAPRVCRRGNVRAVVSWLRASPAHAPWRLPWHLSVIAVERAVGVSMCGVTVAPERPLHDYSAPPYITEHSYVRLELQSVVISTRRQQRHRANRNSRRRPLPLPPVPTNGLTVSLATAQSSASSNLPSNKRDVKRVSQIRIRRASPKETNLTPMGLPRAKRLKKKEFSLEEIYTNKNYKSPSANSTLETIFEEPREKDGALLLIGQQRRRRVLHFPDFTQPRKRKRPPTGAGLVAMAPRKRAAARRGCRGDDCDSDVMLLQRLTALHDFLQRQDQDLDQDQDS